MNRACVPEGFSGGAIERFIRLVARLPGFGPRSARRAVLHMLKQRDTVFLPLLDVLEEIKSTVRTCPVCGAFDTVAPCTICTDHKRDSALICVVENVDDVWALEKSNAFKGRYHVLGGVLSALDGIGPSELRLSDLVQRIRTHSIQEIIIALPATLEGQTTAHYIADSLRDLNVAVSGLARGIPIGGEVGWMDDGTLVQALKARNPIV